MLEWRRFNPDDVKFLSRRREVKARDLKLGLRSLIKVVYIGFSDTYRRGFGVA